MFFDAAKIYMRYQEQQEQALKIKLIMDCAINIPTQTFTQHIDKFGNVDIAKLGCPPGKDGRTFLTNQSEVDDHRNNALVWIRMDDPYNFRSNVSVFFILFFSVNILGALVIGLYLITNWILFGTKQSADK